MKERPIRFTAAMVRAILDGRKTQTRRVVKALSDHSEWQSAYEDGGGNWIWWSSPGNELAADFTKKAYPNGEGVACPYGVPGDRLWVKEAWVTQCRFNHRPPSQLPMRAKVWYLSDDGDVPHWRGRYRSARFMPKRFARIWLEVTGVRVERVQKISEDDARAEGCRPTDALPSEAFSALWDSINAKRGYGWDANPWTWVVEFARIDDAV